MKPEKRFGIVCIRSDKSMLGAATAWAKDRYGLVLFDTLDAAEYQAATWMQRRLSKNITYKAERYK